MSDFVATPQQAVALIMQEAQRRGIQWFNPIHAGGMSGSFMQETGSYRADVINFQRRGDDGTAHGLMQWRGDRYQNLIQFARQRGTQPTDFLTQIAFAFEEGDPSSPFADYGSVRAFREMSQARSARDAAIAFVHAERPAGYDGNAMNAHDVMARINFANQALTEGNADISQFGVEGEGQSAGGRPTTRSEQIVRGLEQNGLRPVAREDIDFGLGNRTNITARENPARPRARPTQTPDFGISGENTFGGLDLSTFGVQQPTVPQSPFSQTQGFEDSQLTFGQSFDNMNISPNNNFNFGLNS